MTRFSPRAAHLAAEQVAEFERVVARFENEWIDGQRPEIERFLPDDGELRPVLLAVLVEIDLDFRGKAGEQARVDDYLARFPELPAGQAFPPDGAEVQAQPDSNHGAKMPDGSQSFPADQQVVPVESHTRQAGKPDRIRFDQHLVASRLVTEAQVRECFKTVGNDGKTTVAQLEVELLRRGWVTRWQFEQLRHGQTAFFIDQNRYLLLSLIGRGGMGAVYKARHVRMARDVALKVIDPKRVTDQSLIQRFTREVEVCSKLQHEHIVQAFDVGIHAGATFLVLEFVEGADLASLVKRDGPMQPGEAVAICLQAAAGLAYAHSEGIVHRDIKPQNILLSTNGIVKILDMGLARVLDEAGDDPHTSLTQEGTVMGTVDYMPPEQARDTRSADARSDIYSLGGTLYYLLAGKPPFAGGSLIEKMQRLANDAPPPLSNLRIDCPRELDEIVQKMLAKRPEDRFQTAGDVVRALRPLAAERISGRAAVTAAVQSAADTLHAATTAPTDAQVLFSQMDESLLTSVRQRRTAAPGQSRKQRLLFGSLVGAVVAVVAVISWSLTSPPNRPALNPPGGRAKDPPQATLVLAGPPREVRRELPGHFTKYLSLAWSPDGRYLATGGADGEVRIREAATRKTVTVHREHLSGVYHLAWSNNSELIASGDFYGAIHVWEARSGRILARTSRKVRLQIGGPFHNDLGGVAISPDRQEIAFEELGNVVRYNLKDKRRISGSGGGGFRLCYSPSGKFLASSAGPFVWSTSTGEPVLGTPAGSTAGSAGAEIILGFLPDDTLVLAREKSLQLWDCRENKLIRELDIPEPAMMGIVPTIAVEPAGDRCRVLTPTEWFEIHLPDGARNGSLWKAANPLLTHPGKRNSHIWCWGINRARGLLALNGAVSRLETAEDSQPLPGDEILPFADAGLIGDRFLRVNDHVWDLTRGEITTGIPANSRLIASDVVRFMQDDRVFTRKISDGSLEQAPEIVPLEGLADDALLWPMVKLTQDGQTAWAPTSDAIFQYRDADGDVFAAKGIRLWDAATGRLRKTIDTPTDAVAQRARANAAGSALAVADVPGWLIRTWRTTTDEPGLEIATTFPVSISRFALSPDGGRLAASVFDQVASPDNPDRVVIWNTTDGRKVATIQTGLNPVLDPHVMQFSSSGRYLLVTRKIWDLQGDAPHLAWECPEADHTLDFYVHYRWGELFADERHVAIAQDAQYQIWDWRENKKLATIFLLPGDQSVFVNHVSGHFSGSPLAYQFLRARHETAAGETEWLSMRDYEKRTKWENNPEKAGLDLEIRNRELAGKAKVE